MSDLPNIHPRIVVLKEDKKEGKFQIYPLEKGVGHTIGTALRRVLLSQIEGLAITEARIEGVYHPFTTIPGVMEDVTRILLNLKEVVLRSRYPLKEPMMLNLQVQGEGEVIAEDIKVPPEIEIANPEHHIATITEPDGALAIEMKVESGKGFRLPRPSEKRKAESPIGFLPLTAIFTPVRKVGYYVESSYFSRWEEGKVYLGELATTTRVDPSIEVERLVIEILTNGALTPSEALQKAASILCEYFQITALREETEQPMMAQPGVEQNDPTQELLSMRLEDLELPSRAYNCLVQEGIRTVGELISKTEKELLKLRNMGAQTLKQVKERLASFSLSLAPDDDTKEGGKK